MTLKERRIAFLYGILTNAGLALEHAVRLAYDRDDGKPSFAESHLVWEASEAIDKARSAFERRVALETVWPEEKP